MNKNVFDLAQEDIHSLKRESYKEYSGPCPRCGGRDRLRVQPGRKEHGAWMCRGCWPAEQKGWGDYIEYLRQMRGMSFFEAKSYLTGEVDSLLGQVEQYQQKTLLPEDEALQDRYDLIIKAAIARLELPGCRPCLDYLLARGLSKDTIGKAKLGCIDSEIVRQHYLGVIPKELDTLFVVIPWYADNILYRVQLRDIRSDIPHNERYRNFPRSGDGLYLGDCLRNKRATFLVEDEFSALSIAQEAGDLVNVVATGSTDRGHTAKWESRLARVPGVLVAFDRDQDGDKASKEWLHILNGATPAKRWKPLAKDANDMLQQGYDIRTWATAGVDYLQNGPQEEVKQPLQDDGIPFCPDCNTIIGVGWDGKRYKHYTCGKILS